MKYDTPDNRSLARELRRHMTPWENRLWYRFLRAYPVRFRRQAALGCYIADFYCAKARLVVELDGGGHYEPEQAERDRLRTQELNAMGLAVLRICNLDVDRNFDGVCMEIHRQVQLRLRK